MFPDYLFLMTTVYHNNEYIFSLSLGESKGNFDNLKKRFSKIKEKYKKTTRSGSGSPEAKQAETELKKYLKENAVSNLLNINVTEINPKRRWYDGGWRQFQVIAPKRAYFWVFRPSNYLKLRGTDIVKLKNVKKRSNKLQKNQAKS